MARTLRFSRLPLFPAILVRERLTRPGRKRQPEPMVMDEQQGADAYDRAGKGVLAAVHRANAIALSSLLPAAGTLLDLGCGSGRLLLTLAELRPDARIIGLDLSEPMLALGRELVTRAGLEEHLTLRPADITSAEEWRDIQPDLVSCNLALHHMPAVEPAQACLEAVAKTSAELGCGVYLFDLARLRNEKTWPAVMSLTTGEDSAFVDDSIASERAAFSTQELTDLCDKAQLHGMHHAQAGLLGEFQLHWSAPSGITAAAPPRQKGRAPGGSRLTAYAIQRSFPRALIAQQADS